jgi:MATE family multidrug resistance protein
MNINKEILRLTLPAVVSNVTVPLLGLVDTAISGHLGSEMFLGAISIGSMMLNVIFWLFGFLRMGTTGLTAQAFGSGNKQKCELLRQQSFVIGLVLGAIIVILRVPLLHLFLLLMSPPDGVREYAIGYFNICIYGAPPLLATMSLSGWFLGMQNTVRPMTIAISVNIVNILLSITFVLVIHLGFEGVAYGTLIANWFGLFLAVALANKFGKCGKMHFSVSAFRKNMGLNRFFSVNTDIFLRSAMIMLVTMSVTAFASRLGAMTLAVNALMMQFFHFFSYFMDGFAFTGEALCGRFSGSSDRVMFKKSVGALLMWSALCAICFFLIYYFFYADISSLLTSEKSILETVEIYKIYIWLIPPLTVAAFIFDGFFIGLTATRCMLIATVIAALAFFAITMIRYSQFAISFPDFNTLWTAFLVYLLLRGISLAVMSEKAFSKALKQHL